MAAAMQKPTPKIAAAVAMTRIPGFSRLADNRAPDTDPIAIIDVSNPN
jgi:hypothetical protein